MPATSQTAAERIDQIDRQINIVRWELHIRVPLIDTLSAASWQAAWDRHPDLSAREDALFRQRGIAQRERDEAEHRAWQRQQRQERAALRRRAA